MYVSVAMPCLYFCCHGVYVSIAMAFICFFSHGVYMFLLPWRVYVSVAMACKLFLRGLYDSVARFSLE